MFNSRRGWLVVAVLVANGAGLRADGGRPGGADSFVPKTPPTQQERNHREALEIYTRAMQAERGNRLLEAKRLLEKAVGLDPDAAPLHRALVPLYLALDRTEDGLRACQRAVELDADDYETAYLYARQLKNLGRHKEATAALARAVACAGVKEHPELAVQMYLDLGVLYEQAPDADRAEAAFREAIRALGAVRKNPREASEDGTFSREELEAKLADTYERVINVCLQARHYDRAVRAFQEAQEQGLARSGRLHYQLATVYADKGEPAKALPAVDEYLKTQPSGTEAYELRIRILKALGKGKEILPSLKYYAGRDAHNISLQLLLARQYAEEGQSEVAEGLYLKVADESPAPDVYGALLHLYRDQRRMGDALQLLDRTIAAATGKDQGAGSTAAAARGRAMLGVFRSDTGLARELVATAHEGSRPGRRLEPETRRFLAVLAVRSHQLEAAERFYRECLESEATSEIEPDLYRGLLAVLWEGHKRGQVVEVCKKGLKEARATDHRLFHMNLARALSQLGKGEEAIDHADQSVNLSEGADRLHMRLLRADVYRALGRHDKAEAECLALLKEAVRPEDVHDVRNALSVIYSVTQDHAKAEEQLRLLLQADAADAGANNDLGYILADQGKNLEEAEAMIRKAIKLDRERRQTAPGVGLEDDQDRAAYLDSLGWVLFRRGRPEAGLKELKKAAALPEGADDPVIWDHLGDVYFRLDKVEQAREAWKKAVSLYEAESKRKPDDQYKEIKHKLQLLEQK